MWVYSIGHGPQVSGVLQRNELMSLGLIDIKSAQAHHYVMRTTINLDDDVLALASRFAEERKVSLGRAVSDLVRRGLETRRPTRIVNGLHVIELPENSPKVTAKRIRDLESELE